MFFFTIKSKEQGFRNGCLVTPASRIQFSAKSHTCQLRAVIYIIAYFLTYFFPYFSGKTPTFRHYITISVYEYVYKTKYLYTGFAFITNMVVLFDQFNLPENVYEIIFATKQQVLVAKLLIEEMKKNDGEMGKTEMSMFATALHEGTTLSATSGPVPIKKETKISYNKRQFYDRILTPMKTMGLIDYDLYKKTYKISEKFNKNMMRVGLMWLQELRKPPKEYQLKK